MSPSHLATEGAELPRPPRRSVPAAPGTPPPPVAPYSASSARSIPASAPLSDTPVGFAYARLVEEPESRWRRAARTLVLDQMGVAKGHRSRGIGEALWNAIREAAAAEHVDRVILNVWAFNRDARRFYERLGFTSFHERMAFELGQRDRNAR